MRSSISQSGVIRTLKRVTPETDPLRIKWLWDHIKTQEYVFDDLSRTPTADGKSIVGAEVWLNQIYNPNCACFEYGDVGYIVLADITRPVNAYIHYAAWDDVEFSEVARAGREVLSFAFNDLGLMRVTATPPSCNRQATRLVTILGFRYEGELRKAFLTDGVYYNLQLYGLLREEFNKREVRH